MYPRLFGLVRDSPPKRGAGERGEKRGEKSWTAEVRRRVTCKVQLEGLNGSHPSFDQEPRVEGKLATPTDGRTDSAFPLSE